MSYSKHSQGDSETAWDTAKEWIEIIFKGSSKEKSNPGFSDRDQREKPFCAGKREREKINKALESEVDKAFQDLNNKMEALHEDFKELQEIAAELEKIPGNKKQGIARVLNSMLNMNLRQLSRRIQTLAEDVEEWPAAIKHELRLLRAYLEMSKENEEGDIAKALESKLNMNLRQLSRRIQTLAEDVQDCLETTRDEFFRAEVEKNPENEEEDIAKALESKFTMNLWQLSQGIENLDKDLWQHLETAKHVLLPCTA
ncbi:uncharacterized protein LOC128948283 isoform X2 [Melozone crissalis]|uniref:uncharacterized protein LOC128948283 isoform X2 n=1 Tax=Melozone crissalis TaxID=40204 RepID=UPI0023DA4108|nr:uncharacterized protein LOC128948283 isoform X2 [Melozone crissalis]